MDATDRPLGTPSDLELHGLHSAIALDLPAYLDDLRELVSIDCGSYTPEGVNEVGRVGRRLPDRHRGDRRDPARPGGTLGDTIWPRSAAGPAVRGPC